MKKLKVNSLTNLVILGLFLSLGCQNTCTKGQDDEKKIIGEKKEQNASDMIAYVNGQGIDKANINKLHDAAILRMKKTGRPVAEDISQKIRGNILAKLIDDEIIKQKAQKEGIKIDRIERVEALEEYKNKIGGPKAFKIFQEQSNITEDELMDTLMIEKLREKLATKLGLSSPPTDEEIKNHYDKNKNLYALPEMVKAKHILLKFSQNEGKEKEEAVLKKINNILAELKEPESSFEKVAQKYSECPSAKNGGDLGFFPRGKMVKPFEDAAFKAPLKTIQGPIKTEFGYHILWVDEKSPAKIAELSEIKDRIVEFLSRNKRSLGLENELKKLRKEAKITINDKSLPLGQYLGEKTESEPKE